MLMMHSTHLFYSYNGVRLGYEEGKEEMLYLTMHSTHFTYGYVGIQHIVTNHTDRKPDIATLLATL